MLFRLVDSYKADLNMHHFTSQCQSVTKEFQQISGAIREVNNMNDNYLDRKHTKKPK